MGISRFAQYMNAEPAMMISLLIVGVGLALPVVVVPIRESLGLSTYQWEGTAKANPYLHDFKDELKKHTFTDEDKLSAWSKHGAYRFRDALTAKSPEDPSRDFPEARQRIEAAKKSSSLS